MEEVPSLSQAMRLTRRQLEAIRSHRYRCELLDGALLTSPSPGPLHQRVVTRLLGILTEACPGDCEVLPAPVDVVLADDTVLVPDVLVGRRRDFTDRALTGAPVLVVEVVSPESERIDRFLKPARLAAAGCPHYWVADPRVPSVTCLALRGATYTVAAEASGDDELRLTEPYPISLVPQSLIAEPEPRRG